MSSFRIERQYVAFQTAETEPVLAANQEQKRSPDKSDGNESDVSKLYNEIFERLQSEHAEQAELMLKRAAEEAREIVENARKQAGELVAQAQAEIERQREELRTQAERAAAERKRAEETELLKMESSLRGSYDTLVDGMRGEVITLVMEIVRKVIGIKLSQSDEVFLGLIRDALEHLKQTGAIVIRVGAEDYVRYFGHGRGPELGTGDMKVTVVEEPDFSAGDLLVESEGEIIDLSIDRQIGLIEKAFLD